MAEAQPTETPAVEETAETAAESSETEAAETVTDSLETTENDSQAEVQTGQKSMSEQIQGDPYRGIIRYDESSSDRNGSHGSDPDRIIDRTLYKEWMKINKELEIKEET